MTSMIALNNAPTLAFDWPSIAWTLLLAGLTFACLAIKARFPAIAEQGAAARVLAHVLIGYFSLGMMTFGAAAAARGRFPVPGGAAWEGTVAVVGGLAAFVIGSTTLVEHLVTMKVTHREAQSAPVSTR